MSSKVNNTIGTGNGVFPAATKANKKGLNLGEKIVTQDKEKKRDPARVVDALKNRRRFNIF